MGSREEWLQERKKGIGASEIGAIIGVSHFSTALEVYKRKVSDEVVKLNHPKLDWGHTLEPVIADHFEKEFAKESSVSFKLLHADDEIYWSTETEYAFATPDRVIEFSDGTRALLEIKNTSRPDAMRWGLGDIPDEYFTQVQWQLYCVGEEQAYFAWLRDGWDFGYIPIRRNEQFIQEVLLPAAKTFWLGHVIPRIPPEVMSRDAALDVHPKATEGETVYAEPFMVKEVDRLLRVEEELKALQSIKKEIMEDIKFWIGDAEQLLTVDEEPLAVWGNVGKTRRLSVKRKLRRRQSNPQ